MTRGSDQDQGLTNRSRIVPFSRGSSVGQHPWSPWSGHVGHPPYRGDLRDDQGEAIDREIREAIVAARTRRDRLTRKKGRQLELFERILASPPPKFARIPVGSKVLVGLRGGGCVEGILLRRTPIGAIVVDPEDGGAAVIVLETASYGARVVRSNHA